MDSLRKVNSEIAKEKREQMPYEKGAGFEFTRNKQERADMKIKTMDETGEQSTQTLGSQKQSDVGAPGIDATKSPLHQTIEAVLEDNLEDLYFSLDAGTQEKFKKNGEETTAKIIQLMNTAKATFNKIFKLIFKWLCIIPGVNRYFLEQEAKIKADRILEIEK